MSKKEPQIAHEDNLKSLLSFIELGTDIESEQCLQLTKQLRYFYFGHLKSNIIQPLTHFMVPDFIVLVLTLYFSTFDLIFDFFLFNCRYCMTEVSHSRHIKWLHIELNINTLQHMCCDLISTPAIAYQNECS